MYTNIYIYTCTNTMVRYMFLSSWKYVYNRISLLKVKSHLDPLNIAIKMCTLPWPRNKKQTLQYHTRIWGHLFSTIRTSSLIQSLKQNSKS